ncbi:MAG: ZIP family metal transporter [Spirochaetales bacterium]|nr:ZIP family metal transporter [Candidatus Physcosoma equi]
MNAILVTLILGFSFLLGAFFITLSKRKEMVEHLSVSLAFGAMLAISLFDLVPEILEEASGYSVLYESLFVVLGVLLLKLLDLFIPEHEGSEESEEGNLVHIGVMSVAAIALHNIVEGMTVYNVAALSMKSGLSLAVGVGLHNIPMGMFIYSTMEYESRRRRCTIMGIATISTFLGGVLMSVLKVDEGLVPYLTSLALGMVIYILFFELLPNVFHSKERKLSVLGTALGLVVVLLSMLFE